MVLDLASDVEEFSVNELEVADSGAGNRVVENLPVESNPGSPKLAAGSEAAFGPIHSAKTGTATNSTVSSRRCVSPKNIE